MAAGFYSHQIASILVVWCAILREMEIELKVVSS